MSAMQRNDEKTRNPDMLLLARVLILIALVVSGCGTRQPALATEQATETPELTITRAPTSTASPLPPSPTPTPGPGDTLISSKDGMVMSYIPAGTFLMGSESGGSDEQPVHSVTLDAFWMDQTEVTNWQYALCVDKGACSRPHAPDYVSRYREPAYVDFPVIYVDWSQAAAYCEWAGRVLPTEAQWEYAARGDLEGALYPWGNEAPSCALGAGNGAQFGDCSPRGTRSVGSFSPNGYGLYDMAGNVWEWAADWYADDYYSSSPAENPTGPISGDTRVIRGGSWYPYNADSLRVSLRMRGTPDITADQLGFRCAISP